MVRTQNAVIAKCHRLLMEWHGVVLANLALLSLPQRRANVGGSEVLRDFLEQIHGEHVAHRSSINAGRCDREPHLRCS